MKLKQDETHAHRMMRQVQRALIARMRTKQSKTRNIDFTAWGHRACPHYFTHAPSDFHNYLGKRLAKLPHNRNSRDVHIGPRGNAKSTYISFLYPLVSVCEEYEKYIILIADTAQQAMKYLSDIKDELEGSEYIEQHYPSAFGKGPIWNTGRIVTNNGICIEALGIGSKIRGRKFRQWRPSCIIVDDPEGHDSVYSDLKRGRCWDRVTRDIFKAGAPGTNIIFGGTNLHRKCTVSRLSKMPGWVASEHKSLQAWPLRMDMWGEFETILADITNEDAKEKAYEFYHDNQRDMDEGADVLWPDYEPLVDLMFIRATEGHAAFEAEKQNNPVDPSQCEWDPKNFPLGSPDSEAWFTYWPDKWLCRIIAIDPSKGREDRPGDFQAIMMLLVDMQGDMYWDADVTRRQLPEFTEAVFNHIVDFKPDIVVCESNQFQELVKNEIENVCRERKLIAPVEGMENYAKKVIRIRRMSPYITRGRFKFRRRSSGIIEFIEQMLEFPNGRHDDAPDAAEMAIRRAAILINASHKPRIKDPR